MTRRIRRPATMTVLALAWLAITPSTYGTDSNSLLDISQDGKLLACSNRDSGTVTIVDLSERSVVREVTVGAKPEGVAFIGDSHRLAVAVYDEDIVVGLDADTGEQNWRAEVFDEPYGVVSDSQGDRLFVTLDYPGRVVELDASSGSIQRELSVGSHLRGIAISSDDQRLYVGEYYTARLKAVSVNSGQVIDEWIGASTDNLLRQIALHPTREKAYLPHIRSRTSAAHGQGSIFPYVSAIDLSPAEDSGKRRRRIPMDAFQGNRVMANPWEIAVSPNGDFACVVFSGTNDMFVCELIDDNYRELGFSRYVPLGANPRAIRLSPSGDTAYVYNALDFEIVGYDTSNWRESFRIEVTSNPLSDEVLAGKKLFYSALQPMVGRRWISCSSCHPDGQPDGRTWQNPEGLRNTQSLGGMAWTHPIHWSADRDEVQDFEHTIRGPLMQGRGLINGRVNESLAEPNDGLSERLDALAAYSNSHSITLSPYTKNGLSESAERGRALFFDKQTRCADCHGGPFYTDSIPRPIDQIVRHDIGSGKDDPSELMGTAYDTPTLLGVYRTAPYLHDGSAPTLRDVLTTANPNDTHGETSHLSEQQIEDLVEFLKALPYQDPVEEARELGLEKIE